VTEVPKPLDAALDLLVYAPVGLAITAAEELPKLAAKGRSRVNTQLMMARVVGQFAVSRGRQELEKRFSPPAPPPPSAPFGPVGAAPTGSGRPGPFDQMTDHGSTRGSTSNGKTTGLPGADVTEVGDQITASIVGDVEAAARPTIPRPDQLAIPGYDSLSASQVVQRLAGLSQDELAAVGAYEQAHRGRRTILNRIDQLQGQ
jgi:hypothetical protein